MFWNIKLAYYQISIFVFHNQIQTLTTKLSVPISYALLHEAKSNLSKWK